MIKIGFIGTGTIAGYMVDGFCTTGRKDIAITLSPRGKAKSAELKAKYPDMVTVAQSNQEVVDSADWIVLAVLPQQAEEVLSELHFTPEKKLLSLVSTLRLSDAKKYTGELSLMAEVVPLSFVARRMGPIVLYPVIEEARELLSLVGDVVAVDSAQEMAVLRAETGMMSAFHMLAATFVDWCCENGMEEPTARQYTTSFFSALCTMEQHWPGDLKDFAREMTPGGLNWQGLKYLEEKNAFEDWKKALDPLLKRVIKE